MDLFIDTHHYIMLKSQALCPVQKIMLINLVVIVSIVLDLYSSDTMQITDVISSLPV